MTEHAHILYRALLNCGNEEDVRALLDDLCTYQEQEQMIQRAYAAKMLIEGKTYAVVRHFTGQKRLGDMITELARERADRETGIRGCKN